MLGVRNTVLFSTPFKTEPSLQESIWRINNTTFASNISIQGTAPGTIATTKIPHPYYLVFQDWDNCFSSRRKFESPDHHTHDKWLRLLLFQRQIPCRDLHGTRDCLLYRTEKSGCAIISFYFHQDESL